MDRVLLINSAEGNGHLEIGPADQRPDPDYFIARLAARELTATVWFYEPRGFALGLAEFFDDLAQRWRGWKGAVAWEAVEGDISLTATHDGLGHVQLTAELRRQPFAPGKAWIVRAPLMLEAGGLDEIARAASRFEQANLG